MSEMIVNKLTGKTSAGDIDVVSEGGNATMQLQQGLAKSWINFNGTGTAINESINVTSMVDSGTGKTDLNFSNAMTSIYYSVQTHDFFYGNGWAEQLTTTSYRVIRRNESGGFVDVTQIWGLIHGDLA